MNVLVTGGTGFLGARLIPALVRHGHSVFALTRSASSWEALHQMGAVPVAGDLAGHAPLSLPAIDATAHAAAHFRFAGARKPYWRTNVAGTAALLNAAENAGAKLFVHISAAGIVMDDRGSPVRQADERSRTYLESFSAYIASKAQGEALVLNANKPGFRTIALRPPAIWGPGDVFSRELPRLIASGQFAFIDRGDYPCVTCHVDNVVEAVLCALTRGTGGHAYFINDPHTQTFRAFVGMIAQAHGVSIDTLRSLPYPLAFRLGQVMEWFAAARSSKSDPPLSRSMVRMIGREFTTCDSAARAELGYVGTTSLAAGVARYQAGQGPTPA